MLNNKEKLQLLEKEIGDISDVNLPDIYKNIWKNASLEVQKQKAFRHNLTQDARDRALAQLCKRPYYLVSIAKEFNVKNIAEVGTAEGLQFYSFAEYVSKNGGHVWSCDIKDVRNRHLSEKYKKNTTFCLGRSDDMTSVIGNKKIDMYYVDGAHDYGDVIRDVVSLKETQSDSPIWVFDDCDERFGCYRDIIRLCEKKKNYKIYRVGNTASGYPTHQAIIFGKF